MKHVYRILHLRPGEGRRILWLAGISVAYAAATALGDDVAQSVFVARAGASALPRMFLFKGLLDVAAAALYLPLTRGRSPAGVWRVALAIYMLAVLGGRLLASDGSVFSAYALYVIHECAWTILTIHWGVFILDALDASQARRLFPLLFTAARLGDIAAGATLHLLAVRVGAINLLVISVVFAGLAAGISLFRRRSAADPSASTSLPRMIEAPDQYAADEEIGDDQGAAMDSVSLPEPDSELASDPDRPRSRSRVHSRAHTVGPTGLRTTWTRAIASPLVRIIAVSTAAMVLVRYGLRMVSIDEISQAFHHDEDLVAGFLGWFGAWANVLGAVLGVLVVPRILSRHGVGVANVTYALATVLGYGLVLMFPTLWSAAAARFINVQLKNALKTPLSTLFYGAEPSTERARARAFVFGIAIPGATLLTAGVFELAGRRDLILVGGIGLITAIAFTATCVVQNRRWRARLRDLLTWKLARSDGTNPERLDAARRALAPYRSDDREHGDRLDDIARALASTERRIRAVGEEVLAETIPRSRAHALSQALATGRSPDSDPHSEPGDIDGSTVSDEGNDATTPGPHP